MGLFSWFRGSAISEAEVRAEVWRLGARHFGSPLEGATAELKAGSLEPARAELLRACVRRLRAAQ
jgi:hypothetical protein